MASQRSADLSPYLSGPAYAVGLLFVVMPIVDTLAQVWPPSVGNPSWRYGTVGIGANYLISVLFGMLLMTLVASFQWHSRTLRVLASLNLILAAVALLATLGFLLDALQVRPGIPRGNLQELRVFDIGAEKAAFKYVASVVVLAWMGIAAWRTGKSIPGARSGEEVPKLVGKQSDG